MKELLRGIKELFYPPRCPCCAEVGRDGEPCEDCLTQLNSYRIVTKICNKCGNEIKHCDCNKYNYLYEGLSGCFWNDGMAKDAVYSIKFRNRAFAARYFGKQVALTFTFKFPEAKPDFVCFVPFSKREARKKDYNHAELIAKAAAKHLNIPCYDVLYKVKDTPKQHTLKLEERVINVKGAYAVKKAIDGKTVLLIDDIKTTGSTLSECAKQLRLCGAEKVYCAVALITSKYTCKSDQSEI